MLKFNNQNKLLMKRMKQLNCQKQVLQKDCKSLLNQKLDIKSKLKMIKEQFKKENKLLNKRIIIYKIQKIKYNNQRNQ